MEGKIFSDEEAEAIMREIGYIFIKAAEAMREKNSFFAGQFDEYARRQPLPPQQPVQQQEQPVQPQQKQPKSFEREKPKMPFWG